MRNQINHEDSLVILFLLLYFFISNADAATFTEKSITCDKELSATLDAQGNPHVYAQSCATFDATGQPIRPPRQIEITNKLTQAQRNGVLAILQALPDTAAAQLSIPTPTPTSTP